MPHIIPCTAAHATLCSVEVHTRHTPSFGVARLVLAAGESVRAEQSAMLASSFGVSIGADGPASRSKGGPVTFTAPADGGWLDLAPADPGDVYALELDGGISWCVARDVVLAQPPTVRRNPAWPGFSSLFGADIGFLEHCSGSGKLVLTCSGPIDAFELESGELISMSPAYLLAYPDGMQCRLRAIDPAGQQSLRTGQGLVLDFAGPGTVLSRARAPQ